MLPAMVLMAATGGLNVESGPRSDAALVAQVETRTIDSLIASPDKRRLAVRILMPSVEQGKVSEQWYIVDTGGEPPSKTGRPAEPIWMPIFDMPVQGSAVWLGQPSRLAVLRQLPDRQAIVLLTPGEQDIELTGPTENVESIVGQQAMHELNYTISSPVADQLAAQQREEEEGVRLAADVNTEGLRLTRNHRAGDAVLTVRRTSAVSARPIPLLLAAPRKLQLPANLRYSVKEEPNSLTTGSVTADTRLFNGGRGWSYRLDQQPTDPHASLYRRYRLIANDRQGQTATCLAADCAGLTRDLRQIGVDPSTGQAILVREDDQGARTRILRWSPRSKALEVIHSVEGILDGGSESGPSGCLIVATQLVCVHASASSPPALVSIDLKSGRSRVLLDPNQRLRATLPRSSRAISWFNENGARSTGILTLPERGQKPLPLVITTYGCRGFLRGGTGMLSPEHTLAQRGIATLCVNLDPAAAIDRDSRGDQRPLARIKASAATYAAAIRRLVNDGLVDKARIGVSGHSFSANVVAYAISHTRLFAAAAIGSGVTIDPLSYYVVSPSSDSFRKDTVTTMGLPLPDRDPSSIWARESPALNAKRIVAPLLFQPPENEWAMALQLFGSIQDAGGVADAYVFPGAGHLFGSNPRQRLARSRRAADWFAFWLKGVISEDPAEKARNARWVRFRTIKLSQGPPARTHEIDPPAP